MFRFLNRCVRGLIWAFWLAMAFLLWRERGKARPALDYFVIWRDVNWSTPAELPRMSGRVTRVLSDGVVQFRTDAGVTWNLGLQGGDTNGLPPTMEGVRFVMENRRLLAERLDGRPVEFAFTQTNVLRTGFGFLYTERTNLVLLDLIQDGRWGHNAAETRVLPIREQYALRVGSRVARESGVGKWAPPAPETNATPARLP